MSRKSSLQHEEKTDSKAELLTPCYLSALLEPQPSAMTTSPMKTSNRSPSKNTANLPAISQDQQLSSPRTARTLRKLQSAHQLSSNFASGNNPSLISQQRQTRNTTASLAPPPVPSLRRSYSHNKLTSQNGPPVPALVPSQKPSNPIPSPRRGKSPRRLPTSINPKDQLKSLIASGPKSNVSASLRNLRYLILEDGIDADSDGMSPLRIYIWLILLDAPPLSTDEYIAVVRRGPSPAYSKIRNDTFRTLATDPLFKRRVSEASLIRLLNAVAWTLHDAKHSTSLASNSRTPRSHTASETGSPQHASRINQHSTSPSRLDGDSGLSVYVQGMNVLAAPFLYCARSETQAYTACHLFLTVHIPGYLRGTLDGVHRGCSLISRILAIIDPKLATHLEDKGAKAEVYAFASVLTMGACTPPLPEVLRWWDFLLGWGWWLNVVGVVGQLVMMREKLLASSSPGNLLRSFPPLQARKLVDLTVSFVRKIPDDLYEELVHHAE